tara:strand:+ start:14426 stop:14998 length:573 start_codon:yes stop_codon:yes gene_type:complete
MYLNYKCLKNKTQSFQNYQLTAVQRDHIQLIRKWRNEQKQVLRQKNAIKSSEQIKYYENNVWNELNLKYPSKIIMSFLYKDFLIGYGGLVNISWEDKRAEMSFLLNTSRTHNEIAYSKDMKVFIYLIKLISFQNLQLNRLYTETFSFRKNHINVLENCNFNFEGVLVNHNVINGNYVNSIMHASINNERT